MADQIDPRTLRQPKAPRAFELDILEQRLILSGENQVGGSTAPDPMALTMALTSVAPDPLLDPLPKAAVSERAADGSLRPLTLPADANAPVTLVAGGVVQAVGDLGRPLTNAGTLSPDAGAGTAVVAVATFTQTDTGVLRVDIGGDRPDRAATGTGHDQILSDGVAQLAGKLQLNVADGFVPTAGQVYDVMKWKSRSGSFSSFGGLYAGRGIVLVPEYRADGLRLTATQLPLIDGMVLADIEAGIKSVDGWLSAVVQRKAIENVKLSASFQIGGMSVAGDWTISVTATGQTSLTLANGAVRWTSSGLVGGVTGVNGSISFGGGTPTVLSLSGAGSVAAFGGPTVAGQFALSHDAATGATVIRATDVTAALGDARRGGALELTNAAMTLTLAPQRQMSLDVSGTGRFAGLGGASFSGTLRLVADTASGETRFVARGAQVSLDGLAALSGDFAFAALRSETDTSLRQTLLIATEAASGKVTLGTLSAQVSNATLAFALITNSPLGGIGQYTTQTAVQGRADLSIAVDDKLSLAGTGVAIRYNSANNAVAATVVAASGQVTLLNVEAGAATISGRISATIAGFGSFDGDLSLAIGSASRLLSDATRVRVTEYALSGIGLSARLGGDTGLRIDEGRGALVYARETDGARAWVTGKGTMDQAALGTLLLSAGAGDGWSVNRALSGLTDPTIDWTEARTFTLSDASVLRLDQVGQTFAVAANGQFTLGGGSLSGRVAAAYDAVVDFHPELRRLGG